MVRLWRGGGLNQQIRHVDSHLCIISAILLMGVSLCFQ